MNKKLLLTIVFVISGIILVNAQFTSCTNVIYTSAGIHPDSLVHADAAVAYYDTLTVNVPTDTTVPTFGTITIDSVSLVSMAGLPALLTATPSASHWDGGKSGCIYIHGTPSHAEAGMIDSVYQNIFVKLTFYTSLAPITYNIDTFTLKIYNNSLGIESMNLKKFDVSQNTPNPFSFNTLINFTSPNAENCQFTVYNVLGDVVYRQSVVATTGVNSIEFSAANLPSGIYMYKLSNATQTITRRMMVEGK